MFWPTPVGAWYQRDIARAFRRVCRAGGPCLNYESLEVAANVALFIPVGALLAVILGRVWLAVLVSVGIAVTAEVVQAVFLPERFSTWTDVVANGAGATVGALVAWVARPRRKSRAPE